MFNCENKSQNRRTVDVSQLGKNYGVEIMILFRFKFVLWSLEKEKWLIKLTIRFYLSLDEGQSVVTPQ